MAAQRDAAPFGARSQTGYPLADETRGRTPVCAVAVAPQSRPRPAT